jgi:flagellar biosynthetic protein FliR
MHEILVGLSIGFSVRIVFAAAEFAGELIGLQMGLNFAGFLNPSNNVQASAMAVFMGHMTALLFVVLNGHLMVLMAVVQSYKFVPLNSGILELIKNWRLHEMGALIFSSAFWMALPVMVLLLFVNLALGIMSRVAPQMNIYAVGFPVTLTAGLVGLLILFPFMDRAFFVLFELALENFGTAI